MTYAKWLEHVQKEKEARAAQDAVEDGSIQIAAASAEAEEEDAPEAAIKRDPASLPTVEYFQPGTNFSIGDLSITPFTTPHDAADPCGFVFESASESIRMAIATDLGYVPPNVKRALERIDVLLLESNHDLEMLKDGPYPWAVKQRVLSRVGHLSNHATAEFLSRDYDGSAMYIVLGHLSETNNAPELALLSAEEAIRERGRLLGNRILLARQAAPIDPICL
jgi:phosphoribosyl 1,2-cyclic phosphodiesterase